MAITRVEADFILTIASRPLGMTPAEALTAPTHETILTVSADTLSDAIRIARAQEGKRRDGGVVQAVRPA